MLEGDRNKAAAITLFGWLTTLKALISTVRFQKGNQYVEWFSDTDGSKGVRTNLTPLFRMPSFPNLPSGASRAVL